MIPAESGTLTFLLDTGSSLDLTLDPADPEAIGVIADGSGPKTSSLLAGASGTFTSDQACVGLDSTLGDLQLSDQPVVLIDALRLGQGNMGNEFLDDFVVTTDWPGKKVYLDPVFEDGHLPWPPAPPAATLDWDGKTIIIGAVVAGSPPAEAVLTMREVAASGDGRSYKDTTREDSCTFLPADPVQTMTVLAEDGHSYDIGAVECFFESLAR